MRTESKIILISLLTGTALWVADALIDSHYGEAPFLRLLFFGGWHEIIMRMIIFLSFTVFGLLISMVFARRKKAEEALREKTIYLDNILRSATEYAIVTTDADMRITYINPLAEEIYSCKADMLAGKTVREALSFGDAIPDFAEGILNIRRYGEHCYTVNRGKGTRYIEARVSGIYDATGEIVGFASFSKDVTDRVGAEAERERLINELKEALTEVETLSGLLPICAYCKKVRDDSGYWNQIETYIRKHSKADFTHSICPECEKKAFEDLEDEAG